MENCVTPQTVVYRSEVRPSDMEAVGRIVFSSAFFSREEVDVARELVQERLGRGLASGYDFLFAEWRGEVVGYTCFGPIACTQSAYDLYWIAVQDEYRDRGLGTGLLTRTEEVIAESGGARIYIETSSRERYLSTRLFYLSCGYREEAVLKNYYAPSDDKVVYLKIIR
jgi:ribosomal protein S18 acetylase RimI-like enzyme